LEGTRWTASPAPGLDAKANSAGLDVDDSGFGFNVFLNDGMADGLSKFDAERMASQAKQRGQITIAALEALARFLSAIPGRKNLIWFAGSFPAAPVAALAAARVALYPVDARGIHLSTCNDATRTSTCEQMAGPLGQGSLPQDSTFSVQQVLGGNGFVDQNASERAAMHQIAAATGGREYTDANDLKLALANAIDDGSDYYTTGYVPTKKVFDGKFRRIEMRVDPGNYQLMYRDGYYAFPPDKLSARNPEAGSPLATTMLHGAPPSTQIVFHARVIPANDPSLKDARLPQGAAGEKASTLKGPVQTYVIDLSIDPHSLVFDPVSGGAQEAQLKFALIGFDTEGTPVNDLARDLFPKIPQEAFDQAMAHDMDFRLALDLPAGKYSLRVGVEDARSGRTGSLEIPLTVGPN
jgi:hypothetical protein